MDARQVDPRYVRWEDGEPSYRVDFWDRAGAECDEWIIEGADDVGDVMRWAHEKANGREFVVYAQCQVDGEFGLLRLHGREPT
ncbi:hypothetical protein [Streptomyces sp. ODS28]|uniref:hypothetical protein n=1 Tax=Streptomyces sp. ODS28 TaxID=3136688 RepID=UPI0031F041D9